MIERMFDSDTGAVMTAAEWDAEERLIFDDGHGILPVGGQ